jgi:hypothetical protein
MPKNLPCHPLVAYASENYMTREDAADYFGIPYGVFRQIVTGHTGVSFDRAMKLGELSGGLFDAYDIMIWHHQA